MFSTRSIRNLAAGLAILGSPAFAVWSPRPASPLASAHATRVASLEVGGDFWDKLTCVGCIAAAGIAIESTGGFGIAVIAANPALGLLAAGCIDACINGYGTGAT